MFSYLLFNLSLIIVSRTDQGHHPLLTRIHRYDQEQERCVYEGSLTYYLRLRNKCLYFLYVTQELIIKKGQCRDTTEKLLPIATLILWEAPALFRQSTHNYISCISFHIPLPPSNSPSPLCEQHSKDLCFVQVGVSLSRLPSTGSSMNGHRMRHTVKRKRSSCRRRTQPPPQTPPPQPFCPFLLLGHLLSSTTFLQSRQPEKRAVCCYGDRVSILQISVKKKHRNTKLPSATCSLFLLACTFVFCCSLSHHRYRTLYTTYIMCITKRNKTTL